MKKYRIEILIRAMPTGALSKLAEELDIHPKWVLDVFKRMKATFTTREKYTEAFNKCFDTNHIFTYLFEEIENEKETWSDNNK